MVRRQRVIFFPQGRQGWLRSALLPLQAYTIFAPVLEFFLSLHRNPHDASANEEVWLIVGLFPCGILLLWAALLLALCDKRPIARACLGFGVAGLLLGYVLLPVLARA
jgi:hypothetical protein